MSDSLYLLGAARPPKLTSNRRMFLGAAQARKLTANRPKFGEMFGELGVQQEGVTRLAA